MSTTTLYMFDDVTASSIPSNALAVAYYTDGRYANGTAVRKQCPNAKLLPIQVTASDPAPISGLVGHENGVVLDVEATDATPAEAPAWVRRVLSQGGHPIIYCSLSPLPTVVAALRAGGIQRSQVKLWVAHYTGVAHICSGVTTAWGSINADATQFTDRALGRSLDESLCSNDFFAAPPAPKPPPAPHEPGLSTAQRTMFWRIYYHNPTLKSDNTPLTTEQRKLFDAIWNDGWNHHH